MLTLWHGVELGVKDIVGVIVGVILAVGVTVGVTKGVQKLQLNLLPLWIVVK